MKKRFTVRAASHIERLDSIRFVAAFWVFLGHSAYMLKSIPSGPAVQSMFAAFSSSFSGISAVMVFFVVSGLCIHLPYVEHKRVPFVAFIMKRYIRIGIPLLSSVVIMNLAGGSAFDRGGDVLWSIYAEIVFYTIYPFLFLVARRTGWFTIFVFSVLISVAVISVHSEITHIDQFGWLVWLWGLPVWLLGCLIAQQIRVGKPTKSPGYIWLWRLSAWLLGGAATFDVFHSPMPIGYPTTMLVFAAFAFFWISKELQFDGPSWRWLERLGSGSYSLYLIHNIVLGAVGDRLHKFPPAAEIAIGWGSVVVATYAFYKVVEMPSHILARQFAHSLSK